MKNNKLRLWLLLIAGCIFIPIFVLIIHIYIVTKDKSDDHRNRQIARIDFKQDVDSSFAISFKNKVLSKIGVDAGYFNIEDKTFIYSYNPALQNADKLFVELITESNIKASRYRANESLTLSGCPVIDKSSVSYKIASLFKN